MSKVTDESELATTGSFNSKSNVFISLVQGAQANVHIPDRWRNEIPNKKLKIMNHVIDWLKKNS